MNKIIEKIKYTFKYILIYIYELIFGKPSREIPECHTIKRIKANGYPVQEHTVQTEDGYIVNLHRIPYSPKNINNFSNKPPIFLQHGFGTSSADWILLGPGKGLAYLLADAGYDVWLGNTRGNTYSKKHIELSTNSKKYWNFTWHEVGIYDIPAKIDYILKKTQTDSLHYVGHSQGTTVFFVLMSMRPEYNKKIISMHAFAPAAYLKNVRSPFVRLLGPVLGIKNAFVEMIGSLEIAASTNTFRTISYYMSHDNSPTQSFWKNILFLLCGYNHDNLNMAMLPDILAHAPAGGSVNQVMHYAQIYMSKKFQQYDYGFIRNKFKYGSFRPPLYDLKKITTPISLYYGDNDWLCPAQDIQEFSKDLVNLQLNYRVPHEKWNHMDFLWGTNVKEFLYDVVLENLEKYNQLF